MGGPCCGLQRRQLLFAIRTAGYDKRFQLWVTIFSKKNSFLVNSLEIFLNFSEEIFRENRKNFFCFRKISDFEILNFDVHSPQREAELCGGLCESRGEPAGRALGNLLLSAPRAIKRNGEGK